MMKTFSADTSRCHWGLLSVMAIYRQPFRSGPGSPFSRQLKAGGTPQACILPQQNAAESHSFTKPHFNVHVVGRVRRVWELPLFEHRPRASVNVGFVVDVDPQDTAVCSDCQNKFERRCVRVISRFQAGRKDRTVFLLVIIVQINCSVYPCCAVLIFCRCQCRSFLE